MTAEAAQSTETAEQETQSDDVLVTEGEASTDSQQAEGETKPGAEGGDSLVDGEEASESGKDGDGEQAQGDEQVEYTFELPEGMVRDEASEAVLVEWSKKHKVSNEAAQELVNMAANMTANFQTQVQKHLDDYWTSTLAQWSKERREHPDLAGPEYNERLKMATQAAKRFGGAALLEAMKTSRMGNHPAVVAAFYRIHKALGEDDALGGEGGATGEERSDSVVFFGDTTPVKGKTY